MGSTTHDADKAERETASETPAAEVNVAGDAEVNVASEPPAQDAPEDTSGKDEAADGAADGKDE